METAINDMVLRSLAAGSMTALLLVQDVNVPPTITRPEMFCADGCITPALDGAIDLRTIFLRSSVGISVLNDHGTSITRTAPLQQRREPDVAELPQLLKLRTGLAIEVLAKAVGVSKVTYHKWLNGAGISEESGARLLELVSTLTTLVAIRQDLRQFLDVRTAAGTPLELLTQRQDALVVGLALRGAAAPDDQSGPRTGPRRVRSLGWARSADRERLEDFSPSVTVDEATEPAPDRDAESVGYAFFRA